MPGATGTERRGPAHALDQHLIELAVVVAVEHHDLVAAGHRSRKPHRGHHRFGPGITERYALVAGQFAEQRGHLAGELGLRADGEAALELRFAPATTKSAA